MNSIAVLDEESAMASRAAVDCRQQMAREDQVTMTTWRAGRDSHVAGHRAARTGWVTHEARGWEDGREESERLTDS